jgi:hypothetical protein
MNEFALVLGMGSPLYDSPWLTAERVNTSVSPAIAFVASIACAGWTDHTSIFISRVIHRSKD